MPKTSMPKRNTGVHLRAGSNVWQWRIKSPKDLQHFYKGEWAHRCSLETSSLVQANLKAAHLYADWLSKFDQQRSALQPGSEPREALELTPEFAEYLASLHIHDKLATDDELRSPDGLRSLSKYGATVAELVNKIGPLDGMPSALSEAFASANREHLDELRDQFKRRDMLPTYRWLLSCGANFDDANPANLRTFLETYLKASVKAAEMKVRRDNAEIIETPPKPTERGIKVYRLRDVFSRWKASKANGLAVDSVKARERALLLYEEFTGNPPIAEVTRDQGDEFRAWLLALGGASKTAEDRLMYVKSLFAYAYHDLQAIPRHPWHGISIKSNTETPRSPWTADQIIAFFSLPLFTAYALPHKAARAGGDAAYWIPLLGLFTGARSAEFCQLRVADIVHEQNIWAMDINDVGEGKRIKTQASSRKVPIHSELIRLGFLDYVEAMRKAGNESLWPKLHLNPDKPSHGFSLWFNTTPRKAVPGVAIPDFHSLRHTVRSALSAADVPEADQDNITGHAVQGSTGTKVYRHVPLSKLQKGVEKIKYQGFSLQRVYEAR